MKVSSAVKSYPNKFLLLQPVKRDSSRTVQLANVFGVCESKQEAFVQHEILKISGIKCFIVPSFDTEEALSIHISGENYETESILSPAEHAKIFRQYYELD